MCAIASQMGTRKVQVGLPTNERSLKMELFRYNNSQHVACITSENVRSLNPSYLQ